MKNKIKTTKDLAKILIEKFQSPEILLDVMITLRSELWHNKIFDDNDQHNIWALDRYFLYKWLSPEKDVLTHFIEGLKEIEVSTGLEHAISYSKYSAILNDYSCTYEEPWKSQMLEVAEGLQMISKIKLLTNVQ